MNVRRTALAVAIWVAALSACAAATEHPPPVPPPQPATNDSFYELLASQAERDAEDQRQAAAESEIEAGNQEQAESLTVSGNVGTASPSSEPPVVCRRRPLSPAAQVERDQAVAWVKRNCTPRQDAGQWVQCRVVDRATMECQQFRGFTRAPAYDCPEGTSLDWVAWANNSAGAPQAALTPWEKRRSPDWDCRPPE